MESIVAKRQLGTGRWDKALKRNMVELSVADNYDEAKEEWIATGEVWWAGNEEIPDWVRNSKMGQGKCLCGHIVVYHFQITNTENGIVECVGSDHINTYLIMRAIAEDEGVPIDAVTDEKIQEWIDVRTKSMKAEAWWKANGAGFEMMFDAVKEIDLKYNVHRTGDYYYSPEHGINFEHTKIRKRGDGAFGSEDYKMASVVWRWNHPDNPRAQINTTGYPNDNLMKDLSLLYVKKEPLIERLEREKADLETKKQEMAERKRQEAERRERIRIERAAQEAERIRIYNLPENVEKRRLEKIRLEKLEEERKEKQRLKQIEVEMQQNVTLRENNDNFDNLCGYYGVPVFDESFAGNDWERRFLADIKVKMLADKPLTNPQIGTLRRILENTATTKQLNYLKSLGYTGTTALTKRRASELIQELLD